MHGYFGNLEARKLRGHFYYSKERDYFWHFATCADIAWSFFFLLSELYASCNNALSFQPLYYAISIHGIANEDCKAKLMKPR
jgi:hypothetical protein